MNPKRVVVIGPESTGKSTLSEALAAELQTLWVPEYARAYLQQRNNSYSEDDMLIMAQGQMQTEDVAAEEANKLLICDTDLNVIKVWAEHKYRRCASWVLEEIARRKYDLYLLTYIDISWEEDPLREHGAQDMRQYFYNIYRDIVQNSGLPWADIRGSHEERVAAALQAIQSLV
ncbi:MAG: ATP-binding protein [Bacteroidetes bacterium]|nr:ATP-binding protein [Bacteroidota bacterium]